MARAPLLGIRIEPVLKEALETLVHVRRQARSVGKLVRSILWLHVQSQEWPPATLAVINNARRSEAVDHRTTPKRLLPTPFQPDTVEAALQRNATCNHLNSRAPGATEPTLPAAAKVTRDPQSARSAGKRRTPATALRFSQQKQWKKPASPGRKNPPRPAKSPGRSRK